MFKIFSKENKIKEKINFLRNNNKEDFRDSRIWTSRSNKIYGLVNIFFADSNWGKILFFDHKRHLGVLKYVIEVNNQKTLIGDIEFYTNRNYSDGIGTALLRYLEDFIKGKSKIVYGNLCDSDLKSHKGRLLHFYRKNGYEVFELSGSYPLGVIKHLTNSEGKA